MTKEFQNKLLLFPKPLLKEVNSLIDNGFGCKRIKNVVEDRYTGKLEIPSKSTIDKYIQWYKETTGLKSTSLIEKVNNDLNDTATEVIETEKVAGASRKNILEKLIEKCSDRLTKLEKMPLIESSAALENCIIGYMIEIRKIVETLLKLSGELKDDDKIVINLVEAEFGKFFKAVAETVKEVYGDDKLSIFKEKLKRKLKGKL